MTASNNQAPVARFWSAGAWIDAAADDQCRHVASLPGVRALAAFPDLHPGKYGPVGAAILADRLYPQLVGGDIGCGMSLFRLDLPARRLRLDKAAERLRALEGPWPGDAPMALAAAGLAPDLAPDALGTVGGGNHFCEVQKVVRSETDAIDGATLHLLVHSGSRSLGHGIFAALGASGLEGWTPESEAAQRYLAAHDAATRWASLNRAVIAQRAAAALRCDMELIADAPHNLATRTPDGFLHRKGAAKADGPLVPLAGSRDAPSYLLRPLDHPQALGSLSHGAGRRYSRGTMAGRVGGSKSALAQLSRNRQGGAAICADKRLLVEEAPTAYKPVTKVLADLTGFGLAHSVAEFAPLITFKTAREDRD